MSRVASATVSFQTSPDPVGAPIFYREVPLPVSVAMDNKPVIAWRVGDVSSPEPPRTVLTGMKTCANCHSFTPDGKTLAMDLDFATDKGAYAIAPIGPDVKIGRAELITWNDFRREDGQETLGFFSTISPNGRYVVSTVKETIVLKFLPDPDCSQIFFPIRGILALYDRETRKFQSLKGGDDPAFVQTNSAFSPDGRTLVFARAKVPEDLPRGLAVEGGLSPAIVDDFAEGRRKIQYDLYRLPFNEGRGGAAEPAPGASSNGRSNFFPKYSPDGRWIVFCQAESMMLNRLDSALYIMPAAGGIPRRLRSNFQGRMNSWHSFSPNGRWLVFASKASGPLTQLWLTHIDAEGNDTPPVMLEGFVAPRRAANIPEFVNLAPGQLRAINIAEEIRQSTSTLPTRPR
jgi:Tol biopolymer transport system component